MNTNILKRFSSARYKRFYYPTRPLFTLLLGLSLLSLGFIGIFSVSFALFLAAAFAFDDLPLTPIMRIITAGNNLANRRKTMKANLALVTVISAAILGALLGLVVFSHSTLFMSLLSTFIEQSSCSPILISIAAISGGAIAHFSHKISSMSGSIIGILFISTLYYYYPIPIPLIADAIFSCAAGCAFIASILVKQACRAYYKIRYGHTNADGYQLDKPAARQQSLLMEQASKFHVTLPELQQLLDDCQTNIVKIKKEASIFQELSNQRQPFSNSYKDIYHGLMDPDADVTAITELIKDSRYSIVQQAISSISPEKQQHIRLFTPQGKLNADLSTRTLYHQLHIAPGISNADAEPFIRGNR